MVFPASSKASLVEARPWYLIKNISRCSALMLKDYSPVRNHVVEAREDTCGQDLDTCWVGVCVSENPDDVNFFQM